MNRGSGHSTMLEYMIPEAFNEAPIHESGKFGSHLHLDLPARPFNEAPIHESGKWATDTTR